MSAEAESGLNSTEISNGNDEHKSNKTTDLIRELREEAKSNRLKAKGALSELELNKLQTEERIKAIEIEKNKLSAKVNQYSIYEKRIVESELKTKAIIAGIKDPDLIKLIDTSVLLLDENGNIDQDMVNKCISDLKESKPFLFGTEKILSTSSNAPARHKEIEINFDALNSTEEEYQVAKKRLLEGKY
jgi:hypothetical protein